MQGTRPTVATSQNTLLELFIKMFLKNLDQSLTLLISVTEEMDCNLRGTFVNLTGFGGNNQSLGGLMPRQNIKSRHNHICHVLSFHYSRSSTQWQLYILNPSLILQYWTPCTVRTCNSLRATYLVSR